MLVLDDVLLDGVHCALILAIACCAACVVGAATPMNSPSCTTTTPGRDSASLTFSETSFASKAGGRSTLPCSMPGSEMSDENLCWPVTMDRAVALGVEVPRTFHLSVGVSGTEPLTSLASFWPIVSSPKPSDRPEAA